MSIVVYTLLNCDRGREGLLPWSAFRTRFLACLLLRGFGFGRIWKGLRRWRSLEWSKLSYEFIETFRCFRHAI